MKFKINAQALAIILKQCVRVSSKKDSASSSFLLVADSDRLTVSANNFQLQITRVVETTSLQVLQCGSICVPASKFEQIVSALPTGVDVTVTLVDTKLTLTAGRSRFSLQTTSSDAFPRIDIKGEAAKGSFTVDAVALREGMKSVAFCSSRNDVRTYLNGMLFDLTPNTLSLAATDGHRLGVRDLVVTGGAPAQFILPVAALDDFANFAQFGEVTITISANVAAMESSMGSIHCKLIDGKFPDYRRLLDAAYSGIQVSMQREEIASAVARVVLLADEKSLGIKFGFSASALKIESVSKDHSDAEEELPCDFGHTPFEVGYRGSYVTEILRSFSDAQADFTFSKSGGGTLITPASSSSQSFLLMPMRL